MEQLSLSTLKTAGTILAWATFGLAILLALIGWFATQVRSEVGRRSDFRVAIAEREAAQASSAAADANARAEEIKAENLATKERLIAAERSLEIERTERLQLERRVAARKVSAEQIEKLKTRLTGQNHVGRSAITVSVFSTTETGEAQLFVNGLAMAISRCGFTINRNSVHYGRPYALHGVGVLVSDDPNAMARGKIFVNALNEIGVAAQLLPPRAALPISGLNVLLSRNRWLRPERRADRIYRGTVCPRKIAALALQVKGEKQF